MDSSPQLRDGTVSETGLDASNGGVLENVVPNDMTVDDREDGYRDLLANIRRLTIFVLDDLEEGSRQRFLDPVEKRLLSSIATRLLRLWRTVLREGGSKTAIEELDRISRTMSKTPGPIPRVEENQSGKTGEPK